MDYEFSKLILQFAQAFLAKDLDQLNTIATQLKTHNTAEEVGMIVDIVVAYVDDNIDETITTEAIGNILQEAGIENYQSFLYFLELSNDIDIRGMTVEEFKAKPFYQYFMGEQKHINEAVGYSFNNRIAMNALLFKDSALLQEVLTRIEQLEASEAA